MQDVTEKKKFTPNIVAFAATGVRMPAQTLQVLAVLRTLPT